MDLYHFGFKNFAFELLQHHQAVLLLCMPRNSDFFFQVQALIDGCNAWDGSLTPGVLDEEFVEPFKRRYNVGGTPTFFIFKEGKELDRRLGQHSVETLTRFAEETLGQKCRDNVKPPS